MHKKINAILIPILMAALIAAFFLLPQKTFSERENRYLATVPELSWNNIKSGRFMEEISDYVSDHFPFRDLWIGINSNVSRLKGKTLINGVYFADDKYLIEKYESAGNMKKIATAVNAFAEKVEAKVTFMAVPTSVVINEEKLPDGAMERVWLDGEGNIYSKPFGSGILVACSPQEADIKILYSNLMCKTVPLVGMLLEANRRGTNEEGADQMFYRQDHHWTSKAAMLAYAEYYYASRNLSKDLSPRAFKYDLELVSKTFRGTLFNKVGECDLGYDVIYAPKLPEGTIVYETEEGVFDTIYDETKLETADQYAYFLSGNHPFVTISNTANEDLTVRDQWGNEVVVKHYPDIVIIKDSYANCMVPFMVGDYHTITIIDPRYYGDVISAYVNETKADEVLFVYNMNTLGTDSGIRRVQ